jgi:hypothetical protein
MNDNLPNGPGFHISFKAIAGTGAPRGKPSKSAVKKFIFQAFISAVVLSYHKLPGIAIHILNFSQFFYKVA